MGTHTIGAGRNWVTFAVGWPIVCGVVYAAWSLFRPSTVDVSGWTIVYGLVVGAVLGGVIGCATFVGGTFALRLVNAENARAAGRIGGIAVFALCTALVAGLTVFMLFALSGQASAAGGSTARVVVAGLLISLTYAPLAVGHRTHS